MESNLDGASEKGNGASRHRDRSHRPKISPGPSSQLRQPHFQRIRRPTPATTQIQRGTGKGRGRKKTSRFDAKPGARGHPPRPLPNASTTHRPHGQVGRRSTSRRRSPQSRRRRTIRGHHLGYESHPRRDGAAWPRRHLPWTPHGLCRQPLWRRRGGKGEGKEAWRLGFHRRPRRPESPLTARKFQTPSSVALRARVLTQDAAAHARRNVQPAR